jgi:hypothetical protein
MSSAERSSFEEECFEEECMQFMGIDLHTNKLACCYRTEKSSLTGPRDKRTETFDLTDLGLAAFYRTLTEDRAG